MGKPHPVELRQRVVAHVEAGNTHRSAATRFDVSVKFVNDMVKLKRATGSLIPKRLGNPGIGKLTAHEDWIRAQVNAKGEVTLEEMAGLLAVERGVRAHPSPVWRLFQKPGLTHKVRRIRKGPGGAFPRRTTFRHLSRNVRKWPANGMSGSRTANPSCLTRQAILLCKICRKGAYARTYWLSG